MRGLIYSPQLAITGQREIIGYRTGKFDVCLIDRDISNDIIRKNHYSGKIVNKSYLFIGIIVDGRILGSLQFGYAMNPSSGDSLVKGTKNDEYMELNRMWLSDELGRNSESMAIAASISLIKNLYKKVRFIQSFADERCGGNGIVYQAANFRYYGKHLSEFIDYNGKWYHELSLRYRGKTKGKIFETATMLNEAVKNGEAKKIELWQFRYIYWVKPNFRDKCTLKELPYPKHYQNVL